DQMTDEQRQLLDRITNRCPEVEDLRRTALAFRAALTSGNSLQLRQWIEGAKQRIWPRCAICLWPPKRHFSRSRGCRHALEHRTGRRPDQPAQNDQAPNVWPRWFRAPPRPCPTVQRIHCFGRSGSVTCIKSAEEPENGAIMAVENVAILPRRKHPSWLRA